jgi:hypothetical protein
MFVFVAAAAVVLSAHVQVTSVADTTTGQRSVSISIGDRDTTRRERRAPRRIPLTPELLRTAFDDSTARVLLHKARRARLQQDSALQSYDATAYQRISAGLGIGKFGGDRLMFRRESVTHVRWQAGVGAWVRLEGARTAIPIAPPDAADSADHDMNLESDMASVPYYPGYESLWIGGSFAKAQVDENDIVHPLAEGAEAYYTYATGDSVSFHLPGGHTIELRELKVRPRHPKWNVLVGSLWFDISTGQLVRAAFRMSIPMDLWAMADDDAKADTTGGDDVPAFVKGLISPMKAEMTAVAIEYGLYNGRFWLPRLQSAQGEAQVSFVHVPVKFEQSYTYASVNALDSLPTIALRYPEIPDSVSEAGRDSIFEQRRKAEKAARDSVDKGLKPKPVAQCDTSSVVTSTGRRSDRISLGGQVTSRSLRVAYVVPCDQSSLASSPLLPGSIYDSGDQLFGSAERDALIARALSLGAQPQFAPARPTWHTGLDLMRFNRIEGFSAGVRVDEQFGAGYAASLITRLGYADLEPNVELNVNRSNGVRTVGLTGYNRLVPVGHWGDPLSFGSSVSALLFGRDDGFYYRASGAELTGRNTRGRDYDWRLFAEQERTAAVENTWSLGAPFIPNIVARRGNYYGGAFNLRGRHGQDPDGFRVQSELRLEAATGDSTYGRGALELDFSQGLGPVAAGLTLSGGTSAGSLPAQRMWYLGDPYTIRGQSPDTLQRGNAYWFTRFEVGSTRRAFRPVIFGDLGWTGDRTRMDEVGRPMSGVGLGFSMLDGLLRLDAARGLFPRRQWRVDMYLTTRF